MVNQLVVAGISLFFSGFSFGVMSTQLYFKKKAKQEIDDEVGKIKQYYHHKLENLKPTVSVDIPNAEQDELSELLVDAGYTQEAEKPKVYLISEEDYNDTHPDYSKETVTYYRPDDLVVIDDEFILSETFPVHPETEDDLLFARNDSMAVDYEINLVDLRAPWDAVVQQ